MRRAREQHKRSNLAGGFERLEKRKGQRRGSLLRLKMVRLVDDDQIPRLGRQQPLARALHAKRVERGHHLLGGLPEIDAP